MRLLLIAFNDLLLIAFNDLLYAFAFDCF